MNPDPGLLLGSVKVDITPQAPIPLAGFAHRTSVFEAVAQPLYARIFCFRYNDGEGHGREALVISADLIWWGSDFAAGLKRKLTDAWGFDAILLHATHTHGGPQTSRGFAPSLGLADDAYLDVLASKIMDGAAEALRHMESVTVERGVGKCGIGINRRKMTDEGTVEMAPNPEGIVDPEVALIRFRSRQGEVKGFFVHYTCHPTTTGDNEITSEYPGAALEIVEEAWGGAAVGAFLQGCCGDIRPNLVKDGQFIRGHRDEVRLFGRQLAEEVVRIGESPLEKLAPTGLPFRTASVELPFQRVPGLQELEEKKGRPGIEGEWAGLLLKDPARLTGSIPLELTYLGLAEGLALLAFNAEMVSAYGVKIRQTSGGSVLPLGYTNGMIGYIPTEEQIAQGGYEARDSGPYFGLPAPFQPDIESRIDRTVRHLIKGDEGI